MFCSACVFGNSVFDLLRRFVSQKKRSRKLKTFLNISAILCAQQSTENTEL